MGITERRLDHMIDGGGRGRLVATCYSPGWRPQIMNGHGAQQS